MNDDTTQPATPKVTLHAVLLRTAALTHLALMEAHGIRLTEAHRRVLDARYFGWHYSLISIRRELARLTAQEPQDTHPAPVTLDLERGPDGWSLPAAGGTP